MTTFKDKGLSSEILQAIGEMGFETPTPIQDKTIPAILENGNDLIALAQTGTGKTAAFGLPVIQQVDIKTKGVQSLILCPTRELCLQIAKDLVNFTKYKKEVRVLAVYGGTPIVSQLNELKRGAHIVVGTPGRTLDLIKRKALRVNDIKWLVLDEADEMLQMGFKDELDAILETTPSDKQTLLFSATMPTGVRKIAQNYMTSPDEISVGKKNQGADNVNHVYYMIKAPDRYKVLKRLADIHPNIYGIVFCRTRRETKDVADKLMQDGYNADALHGDLSQAQRDFVMQRFRTGALQILVATDVAARGLDVNNLTHVINYNLPDDPEIYIHRSGRTGRAGKSGTSIAIVHSRENRKIKELEKISGKKFEHKQVPSGREICETRLFNLVDKVQNVNVDEKQIESFLSAITEKLESLDREELVKRFVSVEFNRFLEYYKNAPDLNAGSSNSRDDRRERGERGDRSRTPKGGFSRFYINLGSKQNMSASSIIGFINDVTKSSHLEIGKIDILRKFSFFEVTKENEKLILDSFKGIQRDDVNVEVQLSEPSPAERKNDRGSSQNRRSGGNRRDYSKGDGRRNDGRRSDSRRSDGPRNENKKSHRKGSRPQKKW